MIALQRHPRIRWYGGPCGHKVAGPEPPTPSRLCRDWRTFCWQQSPAGTYQTIGLPGGQYGHRLPAGDHWRSVRWYQTGQRGRMWAHADSGGGMPSLPLGRPYWSIRRSFGLADPSGGLAASGRGTFAARCAAQRPEPVGPDDGAAEASVRQPTVRCLPHLNINLAGSSPQKLFTPLSTSREAFHVADVEHLERHAYAKGPG